MKGADLVFYFLQSINPIGGIIISIPYAIFKCHWNPYFVGITAIPLTYTQVIGIDLLWKYLVRWKWWNEFLEKKRNPKIEKLVSSGGAFIPTAIISPLIGPWVVMGFMRYANVRQRKVGVPIALGITWMTILLTTVCSLGQYYFDRLKTILPIVGGSIVVIILAVIFLPKLFKKKEDA